MFEWILNIPLDEKNVEMQKLCCHWSRGVLGRCQTSVIDLFANIVSDV